MSADAKVAYNVIIVSVLVMWLCFNTVITMVPIWLESSAP